MAAQLATREGNRIRHEDGRGYGDLIPDANILHHAIDHMDAGDYVNARWCLAVLDLRMDERRRLAEKTHPMKADAHVGGSTDAADTARPYAAVNDQQGETP